MADEYRPAGGIPGDAVAITTRGLLRVQAPSGGSVYLPPTSDPVAANTARLNARRDAQPIPPEIPDEYQGLNVPVGTGVYGRTFLVSGSEQLRKLMSLAFRDCDSENPFQDLGLDQSIIFSINDPLTWNRAKIDLQLIARSFHTHMEFDEAAITLEADHEEGVLNGHFNYTERETGTLTGVDFALGGMP